MDSGDEARIADAVRAAACSSAPEQRAQRRELAQRRYSWSAIAVQYSEFLRDVHAGRHA